MIKKALVASKIENKMAGPPGIEPGTYGLRAST